MSYVKQLIKGNKPVQTSKYDSLLQDLDTVTATASKQWGARGEPTRVSSYADKTRGARSTQAADNERRLENQKASSEVAAKGDERRTSMQLGIDAAVADRKQRSAERQEEGRQARESHEQDMRQATQDFETDWRELAFQEYQSKMTNLDRLILTMNDASMKEKEVALRTQHGFSMQEIDQNTRMNINLINQDFKKWKQDKEISFEKLLERMETSAQNTAQTTSGIVEILRIGMSKIFGGGDK